MRCIAVINQKGGVGKTTSTVNIGGALARRGHKVLLLDIDPQANLSLHLDRRPEADGATMTDLLVDGKPITEMICETATEGLHMVPADTSLSGVETMLANRIGRETILREAIEALEEDDTAPKFDYIFLDCPPSLGVLAANALVSADEIIIPMQAEYFSMQGMTKLMEVMQLVKQRLNPALSICLILPCMVDRRTNLTNEVLTELRQHFGDVLAETVIRSNVKLAEAPSFGRTIFEHAPESNGAHDYDVVADELLRRFAGTFEASPLGDELEEETEEDVPGEAGEIVEPVAADEVAEPADEAVSLPVKAPIGISETPSEEPAEEDGAPFVESVPPETTVAADTTPEEPCTALVAVPESLPLAPTTPAAEPAAAPDPMPAASPAGEVAEPAPALEAPDATNGSPTPAAPTTEEAPVPVAETPATDSGGQIETGTPIVQEAAERQEGSGA